MNALANPHVATRYLEEYAMPQEAAGKIRYNTEISLIARTTPGDNSSGFTLTFNADLGYMEDAHCKCAVVVVATGLTEPNVPETVDGIGLAEDYESQPKDGKEYEGEAVLIFGQGKKNKTM